MIKEKFLKYLYLLIISLLIMTILRVVLLVNYSDDFWLNEKFRGLKTQVNYDSIGVKKGLFTNASKKTTKLVQIV